jgi:hypothetical protein
LSGITGQLVTSNKPVAFFALCKTTAIGVGGLTDMLFQHLAPINTWGKTFFVPVTIVNYERVRIVVSKNGTDIIQTGGAIMTDNGGQPSLTNLQAGQFVELEVSLGNNGCFIDANYPVGVCSFMRSKSLSNPFGSGSQTWIPGIKQTMPKVLMAPFANSAFIAHYALIFTPTATRGNTMVSIGGSTFVPLSGSIWNENTASGMSFYNFQLTNLSASYVFSNPTGIIILGYATGDGNFLASYYYLAGSAMRDLDAAFYANDIHFQDLKDNYFCDGFVEFRAEIEGLHPTHPERLRWFVDGVEETSALDQLTWSRTFSAGEYKIEMRVRYENDEIVSKFGTLTIISCNQSAEFYANDIHHWELPNQTICNKTGTVNFRAEIERLNPNVGSLKWYIDGIEETAAQDRLVWGKDFATGNYEIKMWVHYDNGEEETVTSTLDVEVFWIKMKNVRH